MLIDRNVLFAKKTDVSIVGGEKAVTFCHLITYLLMNYFVVA